MSSLNTHILRMYIYIYVELSIYLSIYFFICLFIYLSIYFLFVYSFIYLFIDVFVCISLILKSIYIYTILKKNIYIYTYIHLQYIYIYIYKYILNFPAPWLLPLHQLASATCAGRPNGFPAKHGQSDQPNAPCDAGCVQPRLYSKGR